MPANFRIPGPFGKNYVTDGDTSWTQGINYLKNFAKSIYVDVKKNQLQLEDNLFRAKTANRLTQNIIEKGSDNKSKWEAFWNHDCVAKVKEMTNQKGWIDWGKRIEDTYSVVKKMKCGNCGEYASVAFSLLKNMGVRPLDFIGVGSKTEREGYTHNFVIIGRESNQAESTQKITFLPELVYWGPTAVVCDAYHNVVYPAIELNSRRKSDRFRHSLYRFQ